MNTLSFCLTLALCFFLLVSSRRLFLLPFIMAACVVPMNQRIILLNLDFTLLRILMIVGILRLTMRSELRAIQWNTFDKLILLWVLVGSVVYVAQRGSLSAVIYKAGFMLDSLGTYWLFRQVVRDWDEISLTVKLFAVFAMLTAPFIALEKFQQTSFFSIFGPTLGKFHRGRFRAAGPFPHYIIMGCFWASLLPFFYAQIKLNKSKLFYWFAIIAIFSNVYFSASSTPIMTVCAIIVFWNLYSYRMHGKTIFWTICCGLFMLHMIMQAPVWHLISRIDVFGGSTGFHRYFLFNNFINHMSEWFLIGTQSTAHWGHSQSDITNQFVLEGVRGGMVTLVIFILIVYRAVKIPGKFSLGCITPEVQWMSWAICVSMLGHFTTFWGVSYFGQINMLLFFIFALVGFTLEQSKTMSADSPI